MDSDDPGGTFPTDSTSLSALNPTGHSSDIEPGLVNGATTNGATTSGATTNCAATNGATTNGSATNGDVSVVAGASTVGPSMSLPDSASDAITTQVAAIVSPPHQREIMPDSQMTAGFQPGASSLPGQMTSDSNQWLSTAPVRTAADVVGDHHQSMPHSTTATNAPTLLAQPHAQHFNSLQQSALSPVPQLQGQQQLQYTPSSTSFPAAASSPGQLPAGQQQQQQQYQQRQQQQQQFGQLQQQQQQPHHQWQDQQPYQHLQQYQHGQQQLPHDQQRQQYQPSAWQQAGPGQGAASIPLGDGMSSLPSMQFSPAPSQQPPPMNSSLQLQGHNTFSPMMQTGYGGFAGMPINTLPPNQWPAATPVAAGLSASYQLQFFQFLQWQHQQQQLQQQQQPQQQTPVERPQLLEQQSLSLSPHSSQAVPVKPRSSVASSSVSSLSSLSSKAEQGPVDSSIPPSAVSPTTSPTCDECEENSASSRCGNCDMLYCDTCWVDMHRLGKLASHQKIALPLKTQCSKCLSAEAVVDCEECGLSYCLPCDGKVHRKGRLKQHLRQQLATSASDPAATQTLVKQCENCESSPADLQCSDCDVAYCKPCDTSVHSKGKLARHIRQSFNVGSVATNGTVSGTRTAHSTVSQPVDLLPASVQDDAGAASSNGDMLRGSEVQQPTGTADNHVLSTLNSGGSSEDLPAEPTVAPVGKANPPLKQVSEAASHTGSAALPSPSPQSRLAMDPTPHSPVGQHATDACPTQPGLARCTVTPLLCLHCDTQDTGTLMQKVLVSEQSIQHLVCQYGQADSAGLSWPSDTGLLQRHVTTVGLYGNKGNIAGWLRDRGLLVPEDLRRLMDESSPGVYCLSSGEDVQYLVFRPTDDAFTEMSRKNISCNMVRYLLELCDEVLTFFAASELQLFQHLPFGSQRTDKRTQKMVVSFQKESDEDVLVKEGFQVEVPARFHASVTDLMLCNSSHVRALHIGETIPETVEFSLPRPRSLPFRDVPQFFHKRLECFQVEFSNLVLNSTLLDFCRVAFPQLGTVIQEYDTEVGAITVALEEELKEQQHSWDEKKNDHRKHIEQAITCLISVKYPLASYFFSDIALQKNAASATAPSSCSICLSGFSEPTQFTCQHVFCKGCILGHANNNGKVLEDGTVECACPECRAVHVLHLDALPVPSRAVIQLWEQEKGAYQAKLAQEAETEKIGQSMKYVEDFLRERASTARWRNKTVDSILSNQLDRLKTMEYAIAVYSAAEEQKLLKPTPISFDNRLAEFVAAAGRNGRSYVVSFVKDCCGNRLLNWLIGSKVDPEQFKKEVEKLEERFKADSSRCSAALFQDRQCGETAQNCRSAMVRVLRDDLQLQGKQSEWKAQVDKQLNEQTTRSCVKTVDQIKEFFRTSSNQLKLVIDRVDVHNSSQSVFLQLREQQRSAVRNIRQVLTFDPLKADLDKIEESPEFIAKPQVQHRTSNLPLDLEKQDLLRLYYLKTGKLMAVVRNRRDDNALPSTDVFIRKAIDNRRSGGLAQTPFSLRRDTVDLLDFDEGTRMMAFHAPLRKRVDVYRFDPDWQQWSLRCSVELDRHMGEAKLTHLLFVPGQEKLCLIDEHGLCHFYDVQDKLMKKRTMAVTTPIDRAMATLDGACLLVFRVARSRDKAARVQPGPGDEDCQVPQRAESVVVDCTAPGLGESAQATATVLQELSDAESVESLSTGVGGDDGNTEEEENLYASGSSDTASSADITEDEEETVPCVIMDIFSLVNLMLIKSVPLDTELFQPECLESLQFVYMGRQMHLVQLNKQLRRLLSIVLDIHSARSVFNMTDLERPAATRSHQESVAVPVKASNCLDYLYYVYDKFCIEDCLETSRRVVPLTCVIDTTDDVIQKRMHGQSCEEYVDNLFRCLEASTHKPMRDFKCVVQTVTYQASLQRSFAIPALSMSGWLKRVVCLVPIQIARAEQSSLTLFADGLKSDAALSAHTVYDLQDSIQLGLYEALLDDWSGPVKVISSMGKQSTGKSYMLNHLTGSLFDISGDRCTDGVWMTLRQGKDCMYVVLDFEGLGSMERTEQEDMFLSIMNAAISGLTVFKTEYRVDQDTRNMLSRFRDGVELIKGDNRLLRGWFYINIKDVDKRDIRDLQSHFRRKLEEICKEDESNFLNKMYRGQLAVQTFPTLGNQEFYIELDSIRVHLQSNQTPSFGSGREFKEVLKLLMAKIHMQEWSSFDRTAVALKVDRLRRHRETALRQGCMINHNDEKESLLLANGDVVPDTKLTLDGGLIVPELPDSELLLVGAKDRALINQLAIVFATRVYHRRQKVEDVLDWTCKLQQFLHAVCDRRKQRILVWVQSHVGDYDQDGDVRILCNEVKNSLSHLRQQWTLCEAKCNKCFFPCLLHKYHDSTEHDCLGDHRCHRDCSYCVDMSPEERRTVEVDETLHRSPSLDSTAANDDDNVEQESVVDFDTDAGNSALPPLSGASSSDSEVGGAQSDADRVELALSCGDLAGHAGKHDCKVRNHTCGQMCHLYGKDNCNRECAKKADHDKDPNDGEHLCNAIQHLCGAECSLTGCGNKCISPYEMSHDRHACRDLACPKKCTIQGCNKKCQAVNDHFHAMAVDVVEHFCGDEHACPEECSIDGICDIVSERKIEEKRFRTSAGDEFSYQSVTDQNGTRKKCCITIPPNKLQHDGSHRCTPADKNKIHFCDRRCPSCGYYCTLRYNHDEDLHSTDHGNMRFTHLAAAGDEFMVDKRRYGQGDSGEAEMCNFHCKSLGRGHIHLRLCESQAQRSSECTVSIADGIRHETVKYGPDEDLAKDELTHAAFWKAIRFQDPCTPEDKELFKLCSVECGSEEHQQVTGDDQPTESSCTQSMWHAALTQNDLARLGNVGHVHSEGHHFKCTHSGTGPLHHILVVDRSYSMDDGDAKPSDYRLKSSHPNRLGAVIDACNQYLEMRHGKSSNDLVSFIAFASSAATIFQGLPLNPAGLFERMKAVGIGGGTNFSPPLDRASEVMQSVERSGTRGCVIVFLSDGEGSFNEDNLRRLLQGRANRGESMVRLHTVKFAGGHSRELQRMVEVVKSFSGNDAFASQSTYSSTVGSIQLAEHFESIATSLNKGGFLVT